MMDPPGVLSLPTAQAPSAVDDLHLDQLRLRGIDLYDDVGRAHLHLAGVGDVGGHQGRILAGSDIIGLVKNFQLIIGCAAFFQKAAHF